MIMFKQQQQQQQQQQMGANSVQTQPASQHSNQKQLAESIKFAVAAAAAAAAAAATTQSQQQQQHKMHQHQQLPATTNKRRISGSFESGLDSGASSLVASPVSSLSSTSTCNSTQPQTTTTTITTTTTPAITTPTTTSKQVNGSKANRKSAKEAQATQQSLVANLLDFFPELKHDGLKLTWQHDVNSSSDLNVALASNKLVIGADISLAETSRYPVPIMSKPSNSPGATVVDFTLETWIKDFLSSNVRKAIKLSFTSTRTVEPAFRVLAKYADSISGPLILSANIASWPTQKSSADKQQLGANCLPQPVDAWTFLMLCRTRFPKCIISIGWCKPEAGNSLSAASPSSSLVQQMHVDNQLETASLGSSADDSALELDMHDANSPQLQLAAHQQHALSYQIQAALHQQQQQHGQLGYFGPVHTHSLHHTAKLQQHHPYAALEHLQAAHSSHLQQRLLLAAASQCQHYNTGNLGLNLSASLNHGQQSLNSLINASNNQSRISSSSQRAHILTSSSSLSSSSGHSSGSPSPTSPSHLHLSPTQQSVATNLSLSNSSADSKSLRHAETVDSLCGEQTAAQLAAVAAVVAASSTLKHQQQQHHHNHHHHHQHQQQPLNLNINSTSFNQEFQSQFNNAKHCAQSKKQLTSKALASNQQQQQQQQLLLKQSQQQSTSCHYYTHEMIDKMASLVKEYNLTQPVTFPVEAKLVRGSLVELQRLLGQFGANATLTIVASQDDLISVADILFIRKAFLAHQLMFDLPDELLIALEQHDERMN